MRQQRLWALRRLRRLQRELDKECDETYPSTTTMPLLHHQIASLLGRNKPLQPRMKTKRLKRLPKDVVTPHHQVSHPWFIEVLYTHTLLVAETPSKMTPGKKHHIFEPETPEAKNGRRKSDGTQSVSETPNIDAVKQENTPKSLSTSLLVRQKTSFYSGTY